MLDLDASGKWAESLLSRIKSCHTEAGLEPLREAIAAQEGKLMEPRYPDILRRHIAWKQAEFDRQKIAGKIARKRIDETLVELGLRPERSHE